VVVDRTLRAIERLHAAPSRPFVGAAGLTRHEDPRADGRGAVPSRIARVARLNPAFLACAWDSISRVRAGESASAGVLATPCSMARAAARPPFRRACRLNNHSMAPRCLVRRRPPHHE
jgi:hypothetical protein